MAFGKVGRPKGLPKTGGRKPGACNKHTADLKEMILGALQGAGGMKYLIQQAKDNPAAFLALVGKIVPRDIKAEIETKVTLEQIIAGS
jgi:hypothetical protein